MTGINMLLLPQGSSQADQYERAMQLGMAPLIEVAEAKAAGTNIVGSFDLAQPWGEVFGDEMATRSGVAVSAESALRISSVWACRRVISEDVAVMPLKVWRKRRDSNGKSTTTEAPDHPVAALLAKPCDWLRRMEFIEWMVGVATVHKGAYAYIVRDASGTPSELLPLLPGTVTTVQNTNWDPEYYISGYGKGGRVDRRDLFILHGPLDASSMRGYGVAALARESIGLAAAIESSQARFHANDMRPSGAIQVKMGPGSKLTAEQRDRIRTDWKMAYGPNGTGGVAVLDQEFDFKTFALNAGDQQVIENRKMQIEEICRFFRVFPQLVMHNGGNTYGSFEQALSNHMKNTLLPWVKRLEEAATDDLLSEYDRAQGYYIDIDTDASLRGTPTDRASYYEKASKLFLTPNDIRELEGHDRIDNDPDMNRVQLQRNNTGMTPSAPPKPVAADTRNTTGSGG